MRAAVTGATAACFHTFTKRCTAVTKVSARVIHRIGMSNGGNNRPMHNAMMRNTVMRNTMPCASGSPAPDPTHRHPPTVSDKVYVFDMRLHGEPLVANCPLIP